jgi:hypothetical protein
MGDSIDEVEFVRCHAKTVNYIMSTLKKLAVAVGICAVVGCSREDSNGDGVADGVRVPDTVSVVGATNAVGTVSGQIVTAGLAGLEGATVTLLLGKGPGTNSYKATSDTDGVFVIRNLPAPSSGQLLISKMGHGTVRLPVSVGAAAGQFPVNDANTNVGQVGLFALTSSIKFQVFTANGAAARGAKAYLEAAPAGFQATGGSYGFGQGVVSVESTVDEMGTLTFTGLPSLLDLVRITNQGGSFGGNSFALTLSGLDSNMDGRLEFEGLTTTFTASALLNRNQPPLVLSDARAASALDIISSNVGTMRGGSAAPLRNMVKPTESVSLVFNQPIIEGSLVVRVTDETCSTIVNAAPTSRAPFTIVTVAPPMSGWLPGKEYNLAVRATSAESGTTLTRVGFFFVGDPEQPGAIGTSATFQIKKAAGNMTSTRYESGDEVFVIFALPLRLVGGPAARVFVGADLDGSGSIGGMSNGEIGSPNSSFVIADAEPLSDSSGTFTCIASGYTTRFRFPGLPPGSGMVANSTINVGATAVRVSMPRETGTTLGYQTVWGQPVTAVPPMTADFNGMLSP